MKTCILTALGVMLAVSASAYTLVSQSRLDTAGAQQLSGTYPSLVSVESSEPQAGDISGQGVWAMAGAREFIRPDNAVVDGASFTCTGYTLEI